MDRIAGFYRFLWPFLAADESQVGWLDENTGGRRNRAFLAEIPARYYDMPYRVLFSLIAARLDATRRDAACW